MTRFSPYLEFSFLLPFMVVFPTHSNPTHSSPLCYRTSVPTSLLKLLQTRPQWCNRLWSYFTIYLTWCHLEKAVPPSASVLLWHCSVGFLFLLQRLLLSHPKRFLFLFLTVNVDLPSPTSLRAAWYLFLSTSVVACDLNDHFYKLMSYIPRVSNPYCLLDTPVFMAYRHQLNWSSFAPSKTDSFVFSILVEGNNHPSGGSDFTTKEAQLVPHP